MIEADGPSSPPGHTRTAMERGNFIELDFDFEDLSDTATATSVSDADSAATAADAQPRSESAVDAASSNSDATVTPAPGARPGQAQSDDDGSDAPYLELDWGGEAIEPRQRAPSAPDAPAADREPDPAPLGSTPSPVAESDAAVEAPHTPPPPAGGSAAADPAAANDGTTATAAPRSDSAPDTVAREPAATASTLRSPGETTAASTASAPAGRAPTVSPEESDLYLPGGRKLDAPTHAEGRVVVEEVVLDFDASALSAEPGDGTSSTPSEDESPASRSTRDVALPVAEPAAGAANEDPVAAEDAVPDPGPPLQAGEPIPADRGTSAPEGGGSDVAPRTADPQPATDDRVGTATPPIAEPAAGAANEDPVAAEDAVPDPGPPLQAGEPIPADRGTSAPEGGGSDVAPRTADPQPATDDRGGTAAPPVAESAAGAANEDPVAAEDAVPDPGAPPPAVDPIQTEHPSADPAPAAKRHRHTAHEKRASVAGPAPGAADPRTTPDAPQPSAEHGTPYPVPDEEIVLESVPLPPRRNDTPVARDTADSERGAVTSLRSALQRSATTGRSTTGARPAPRASSTFRKVAKLGAWITGCVALVGLLMWQGTRFYIQDLAQVASLRPVLQNLCIVLACAVPPRRSPKRIDLVGTSVSTHPEIPGALRVAVNVINRAEFSQGFPYIEVTLTDKDGRTVGRQSYEPQMYGQRSGTVSLSNLEPNVVQQLTLDLASPPDDAVGYEVQLLNR